MKLYNVQKNIDENNNENIDKIVYQPKNKKEKRKKIQNNGNSINNVIMICLLVTTLSSLSLCIFLLLSYNKEKENTLEVMNQLEIVKEENEHLYSEDDVKEMLNKKEQQKEEEKNKELEEQRKLLEEEKKLLKEEMQFKFDEEKQLLEENIQIQLQNNKTDETNIMLDNVRNLVDEGEGMMTLLQTIFPNDVVVASSGKYHLLPINHNLNKNNFDLTKFTYPQENESTGKLEGTADYVLENGTKARKGIDVSTYQGDINWQQVKNTDIDFAIIRLGFRGYETGKIVLDNKYENNVQGSINAGIDTGVYFFTEAINEKEAIEEADFVIENLKGYNINMPVVLDVEESASPDKTRTKDVTPEQRTKNVIAFCERIEQAGYKTMIYGNLKSFMIMMKFEELEKYDKWFAYYRFPFHFPYKIKMWQYTSTERVDGINGDVDVNIMFY